MRQKNVIDSELNVISARKSAAFLRLNNQTFFRALAGKVIRPQARIDGESRVVFGFEKGYLEEIDRLLPKNRGAGQPIFSRSITEAIEKVNAKWEKQYPQMRES